MLVNRAWTAFALANDGDPVNGVAVGANYLEVCRGPAISELDAACAREALEGLQAVLDGARAHFAMEYPCDSPSQQRWYLMDISALDLEKRVGAIVSHQDITARKQAELALSASEARFRAMFDHAAVGIAEIAADGRFLRANAALLRIVGRTAARPAVEDDAGDHPCRGSGRGSGAFRGIAFGRRRRLHDRETTAAR